MIEAKKTKLIEIYNISGAFRGTLDYEETRKRYGHIVAKYSPRKDQFSDSDLVDFLNHFNSYSLFKIVLADDPSTQSAKERVKSDVG